MPISIPQDIVEEIVQKLQGHRQALSACALVSESFRSCSQRHLYSSLIIYLGPSCDSPHRCRLLLEILSRNLRLGTYVRELWVTIPGGSIVEATFPTILRMLPHIRLLNVGSKRYQDLHWNSLPNETKHELLRLFHSPNLVELSLDGIKLFPASLMPCFLHLWKLRLSNVDFTDDTSAVPAMTRRLAIFQSRLEYLDVWSNTPQFLRMLMAYLSHPVSVHPLSHLCALDIGLLKSDEDIEGCQSVLICAEQLESLLLNVDPSNSLKCLNFEVPALALKRLRIYLEGNFATSLQWLDRVLKTLPSTSSMKEILIDLDEDVNLNDDAWTSLDKSLVSAGASGCLDLVTLCLFTSPRGFPHYLDFSTFFNDRIPCLAAKDYLSTFCNDDPVYPQLISDVLGT